MRVKQTMMYMKLILTVCCLLIFVAANAQYQISGRIVDENNQPITGQTIQLIPAGIKTMSKNNGEFLFEEVKQGVYTLVFDSEWWQITKDVTVDKNISDIVLQPNTVLPIEEVVIKSIRFGQANSPTQQMLTKKSIINQLTVADLPYILQFTPSVIVTSDAGAGTGYTSMRIRGSDQTRINVTINGVPLNDAESQNVFFVDLPDLAASAQNIQIQRGAGTSSHGAASFGASINVNTHTFLEEAGIKIGGVVGSFNTKKASLEFNTGKIGKGLYLNGRLSQITSDGYIDRATSDLKSLALSPLYIIGKSSIRYDLLYGAERTYQAWYGIDADLLESNRTFNPAGMERQSGPYPDQVDDYKQVHHQLHVNTELTDKINFGISAHYTPGNGFYEEYKANQYRTDYGFAPIIHTSDTITMTDLVRRRWLDNHFYGFVGSMSYQINNKSDLIIGGGWNHYKGRHFGEVIWAEYAQGIGPEDKYYDNKANKYDASIYAKYSNTITPELLTFIDLQYRSIKYNFIGPDRDGQATDQQDVLHFFNPKIGLTYYASDKVSIVLQSGIAQKEPNRSDYIESSPISRPRAEWLWDTELGANWQLTKALVIRPNIYYMKYKDQLTLTGEINDVGAATRINVDNSYRLGLEFDWSCRIGNNLMMNGNFNLSRNRLSLLEQHVDSYDEEFNYVGQDIITLKNTPLPFSPHTSAFLGLRYQFIKSDNLSSLFYLNTKHVGEQCLDLSGDEHNKLSDYQTFDVGIEANLRNLVGKLVKIKVEVNNLFATAYESNGWSYKYILNGDIRYAQGFYPQALRHYNVSLITEF